MQISQYIKRKSIIQYCTLYALLFLIFSLSEVADGDDAFFVEHTKGLSLFGWVSQRYAQWSGRIFSEACVYLVFHVSTWLWYIITPLALLALARGVVRVFKARAAFGDVALVCCLLLSIERHVFGSSMLWMTGALFYLWPTALGVCAMVPYADALFRGERQLSWPRALASAGMLLPATLGTEQISACLLGFALVAHASFIIKKERPAPGYYLMLAGIVAGMLIIFLCPGNSSRMEQEEGNWYPGFFDNSAAFKSLRGMAWMFELIFKNAGFFISILSSLALYTAFLRGGNTRLQRCIRAGFLLLFIVRLGTQLLTLYSTTQMDSMAGLLLYDYDKLDAFIQQHSFWAVFSLPLKDSAGMLLPYVFAALYLAGLLFVIYQGSRRPVLDVLLMVAGILSLMIMFVSPTIYVSGNRVFFVFFILCTMIIYGTLQDTGLASGRYMMPGAALLAALNVFNLLSLFLNGYYVVF